MNGENLTVAQIDGSLVWLALYVFVALFATVAIYAVGPSTQTTRRVASAVGSTLLTIPLVAAMVVLPQEYLGLPFWLGFVILAVIAVDSWRYIVVRLLK